MALPSRLRRRLPDAAAVIVLAALPLWLARAHWRARWPYSGDAVSMVLPTAIARRELAAGRLPTWSGLYFQGESLLNPHAQLLYPPWWLTLGPLELPAALKLVLGLHFVAAPLLVYWYARRASLPVPVAAGLGAAAALPLARLSWHHQKTLGWPWLLLLACQLLPWEWADARRSGLLVGLSGGAMVLSSSLYFAWYGALLAAPLFLLYRERERWLPAVAGAAVALPALALNLMPYLGSPRPAAGWWLTPPTLLAGLTGFGPPERTIASGYQLWGVPFEGYAVVGLGVVCLGLLGAGLAVADGGRRWARGVAAGGAVGLALATLAPLYALPVVGAFRTAGRANVAVALALLVFAVYACRALVDAPRRAPNPLGAGRLGRRGVVVALTALLVVNAALGAAAWGSFDRGDGTDLAESRAFAADLPDDCGDAVWVEMYQGGTETPRGHLGMALLDAGYRLDAVYYAAVGADYGVRDADGDLAFDLLISPAPIEGTATLTGGSAQVERGRVSRAELRALGTREYRGQRMYVYARAGACDGAGAAR